MNVVAGWQDMNVTGADAARILAALDAIAYTHNPDWLPIRTKLLAIAEPTNPFVFKREGDRWRVGPLGSTRLAAGGTKALPMLHAALRATGKPIDGKRYVNSKRDVKKALNRKLRHSGVQWARAQGLPQLEVLFTLVAIDHDGSLRIDVPSGAVILD